MQHTLFPEYDVLPSSPAAVRPSKSRQERLNDYDGFVEKFKPKQTTDDCYTPPAVYDVVLDWVRKNCDIEGCNIVRPFYPGGDYEAVEYRENDVVVDNPPFSIISQIVCFYVERGVRFFLFAPYLTVFRPGRFCSSVVCDVPIVYENGAKVATSFVTNMLGDICAMTAPDLADAIEEVQRTQKVKRPKYVYPKNIIRATDMGYLAKNGISLSFTKDQAVFVKQLESQGKESIFGGGYLVSDQVAADRIAADQAAASEAIEWRLSDRELEIVKHLNP